jgi:di/tricarboxylate transporter
MTDQLLLGGLLLLAIALFLWGRWRHDVVAFVILIAAVVLGLVPSDEAFLGFGHPAVITVALVLAMSKALEASGMINALARRVTYLTRTPFANIVLLTALGAFLSAFMNNVGALALLMPLAMQTARNPSLVLMPLSFGTILGGMMTEIGTPPNIIIAAYREKALGAGYGMFDFTAVGGPVALMGVLFLVVIGWRLIPKGRQSAKKVSSMLVGANYVTEATVPDASPSVGKTVRQLERSVDNDALVLGIVRHGQRLLGMLRSAILRSGDVLILRADQSSMNSLVENAGLELVGQSKVAAEQLRSDEIGLLEVVVSPGGKLARRSAKDLRLHSRYGVNILAISRHEHRFDERVGQACLEAGDVILVQGEQEVLRETMIGLGGIPVAQQGLRPPMKRWRGLPAVVFALAIAAVTIGLLPIQIAFAVAVAVLVVLGTITAREIYETVDWSVIILLGALIPLGNALDTSGAIDTLAMEIIKQESSLPVWALIATVMAITMALTNLMNNAATAIVMAPLGLAIAAQLGVDADPFLMAVAIAASSAFLTPIGHQNNVLIMGAGGYRFGDYWRMGLPLQVLILVTSVPMIIWVWGG